MLAVPIEYRIEQFLGLDLSISFLKLPIRKYPFKESLRSFNGPFLISGSSKVGQDDIIPDLGDYIVYFHVVRV